MSSYREDPLDRYPASAASHLGSGRSPHFSGSGSSGRRRSPHSGDRRSSRRSRSPRNSARMADDWTRSTDAFLDTLTKSRGSFGTSPPQTTYNARSRSNLPNQAPLLDFNDDRRSPSGLPRKSRSKSRSPSNKKSHRSASSSSDESAPKSSEVAMSKDEHDKLKAQRQQYREATRKLEDQLMKLKEQREAFKAGGAKHEDLIMKENARIQKELKARILKMGEIIGQVESTLERAVVQVVSKTRSRSGSISPVPKKPKKRAQSRSPRVEEREPESKMRGNKHSDHRAPSTSSEDESKSKTSNTNGSSKKKRKKKSTKNSSSSAADESDSESKRRKKKRKKDKKRSTSSSESEGSDMETQAKKKSTAKGEGGARVTPSNPRDNDELMALLAKMSDAFMKSKKDCKELQARINLIESENIVLKKQVKELRARDEERIAADQARHEREIQAQAEKERSQIMEKAHLLLLDNAGTASRTEEHRGGGGPRTDDHKPLKDPERRHEVVEREEPAVKESDRRADRPERHARSSPSRRRSSREREERRRDRSRRDESPRRERSRQEDSPKRERSHRETRKEAPEAPRPPPPKSDRNDKINLDDWVSQPQMKERVDPNLESIRAKVMEKRQKMQDEDKRSRWATVYQSEESQPVPHPEPVEPVRAKTPEDQKLPEGPRAHVALQWGSHSKKATSPSPGSKKANAPVIGKMPGRSKRSSITPQRTTSAPPSEEREMPKPTRFGPRSDLKSIPPPTVVQPHPDQLHRQSPPPPSSSASYGITREMYMQAITATMPTEPPPPQEALAMRYQQAQPPPKNPTPQPIDISSILAAAQQHIQSKVAQMRTPKPVMMKIPSHQNLDAPADIPLPPLPAAVDKDDMAGLDTRPPKVPTPPMPVPKTELDYMMEKHASPPRGGGSPPSAKAVKASPFEKPDDSIEMDPEELAMLGIDPNDLTGFGAKK